MSIFNKYQHLERFNTYLTNGLAEGACYIFPKLDGTNGSIWLNVDGNIYCGSRNRILSADKDNAGFYVYVMGNTKYKEYLTKYPNHILYGEWLVPHTIKNYEDYAWKKFYVFDVKDENGYVHYNNYYNKLVEYKIDYIPLLQFIDYPTKTYLESLLHTNNFLMKSDEIGEGIVIKNYEYKNVHGNQVWAKIVTSEFKTKHKGTFLDTQTLLKKTIEEHIVYKYCTNAFVEKEILKFYGDEPHDKKKRGQLLKYIVHELLREEIINIMESMKYPTINFKQLSKLLMKQINQVIDSNT